MTERKETLPALTPQQRIAAQRAPTEAESAAIEAAKERNAKRPKRLEVRTEREGNTARVSPLHNDHVGWEAMTRDATGSSSGTFGETVITRLETVIRDRGAATATDQQLNAALAAMGAVAPENEIEALIGEQIVATHALSMEMMAKAKHTDTMPKMEAFASMATKLSRTMLASVEALSKIRNGGKQQVEVRYVYVDARGSQNVIGGGPWGASGGGKGNQRLPQGPRAAIAFDPGAPVATLLGEDESGDTLPVSSDARAAQVLPARREVAGSAEGREAPRLETRRPQRRSSPGSAVSARSGAPRSERPR